MVLLTRSRAAPGRSSTPTPGSSPHPPAAARSATAAGWQSAARLHTATIASRSASLSLCAGAGRSARRATIIALVALRPAPIGAQANPTTSHGRLQARTFVAAPHRYHSASVRRSASTVRRPRPPAGNARYFFASSSNAAASASAFSLRRNSRSSSLLRRRSAFRLRACSAVCYSRAGIGLFTGCAPRPDLLDEQALASAVLRQLGLAQTGASPAPPRTCSPSPIPPPCCRPPPGITAPDFLAALRQVYKVVSVIPVSRASVSHRPTLRRQHPLQHRLPSAPSNTSTSLVTLRLPPFQKQQENSDNYSDAGGGRSPPFRTESRRPRY